MKISMNKFIIKSLKVKKWILLEMPIVLLCLLISQYSIGQETKTFFHSGSLFGVYKKIEEGSTKYNPQSGDLYVGNYSSKEEKNRGYLEFDLSSIPFGSEIQSATLNIKTYSIIGTNDGGIIEVIALNGEIISANSETWDKLEVGSQIETLTVNPWTEYKINGDELISEIKSSMNSNSYLYLGLVNSYESTEGISLSTLNSELYLDVKFNAITGVPSNISSSNITDDKVELSWKDSYGVNPTGYYIYKDGKKIAEVTNTSYEVSGLTPATSYKFQVSAFNDYGESPKSDEKSVLTKPSSPDAINATDVSCEEVILHWSIVPGQVSGYKIYCEEQLIKTVESATSTTYSVTGLAQKTQYSFVVKAFNSSGESYDNPTIDVETLGNEHIPFGPYANVSYNSDGSAKVRLNWGLPGSDSSFGIQYYRVYYRIRNSIVVRRLTTNRYIEFSTLNRGYIHRFSVTSFNGVCESYESKSFDLDLTNCANPPSKPSNLEFTPHYYSGGVPFEGEVSWSCEDAIDTSYKLWLMDDQYHVVQSATTTNQSYHFYNLNGNYKLLVEAVNDCGNAYSDLLYFTLSLPNSLKSSSGKKEEDLFNCISAINQYKVDHFDNSNGNSQIEIYPNPAKTKVFISGDEIISCNIYDMNSRLVRSISNPSREIDITQLPEGLYIFKIKTNKGITSKKVTKQ